MQTITRYDLPICGYTLITLIADRQAKLKAKQARIAKIKSWFTKPKKVLGDTGFVKL